jgi:hypothetical protein
MTFQRGQFVRITYGEKTIDGMVLIASANGKSMMLGFDGALRSPAGGAFMGSMPVLMDYAGVYRDLVENEPVQIQERAE